ncbi:DMT family transporter [Kordiimonas aestuarii]|uniref:DMT family transporter n=1 Tax=Kordiimonas aestuarii TaxID=1005925 RepID=UPI0021CE8507|nr:DMT family transporter [Kordiimonas aestuarii]
MDPNTLATLLILTSAALHASWNAVVKRQPNKLSIMVFISVYGGLLYIPFAPFFPLPEPWMWGYIAASVAVHLCYQLALTHALEVGELTFVYPIARGLGPLLVALFSLLFLEGSLAPLEFAGVLILVCGIFLTVSGRMDSRKGLSAALITGCMIATYTLIDGFAVKRVENPVTFIIWGALSFAPVFATYIGIVQGPAFLINSLRVWKQGLPAAVAAQGGYAIALTALSLGSIGEVAALRETSIIFATLIGALWLKEKVHHRQIVAVLLIALGAVSLKLT